MIKSKNEEQLFFSPSVATNEIFEHILYNWLNCQIGGYEFE